MDLANLKDELFLQGKVEYAEAFSQVLHVCHSLELSAYLFEQQVKDTWREGYLWGLWVVHGNVYFQRMRDRAMAGTQRATRVQNMLTELIKLVPGAGDQLLDPELKWFEFEQKMGLLMGPDCTLW